MLREEECVTCSNGGNSAVVEGLLDRSLLDLRVDSGI